MRDYVIKHSIIGIAPDRWIRITIPENPTKMPKIPKGHKIVGGIHCDDGERLFICETLEAVKELQNEATARHADLLWYHTDIFI